MFYVVLKFATSQSLCISFTHPARIRSLILELFHLRTVLSLCLASTSKKHPKKLLDRFLTVILKISKETNPKYSTCIYLHKHAYVIRSINITAMFTYKNTFMFFCPRWDGGKGGGWHRVIFETKLTLVKQIFPSSFCSIPGRDDFGLGRDVDITTISLFATATLTGMGVIPPPPPPRSSKCVWLS